VLRALQGITNRPRGAPRALLAAQVIINRPQANLHAPLLVRLGRTLHQAHRRVLRVVAGKDPPSLQVPATEIPLARQLIFRQHWIQALDPLRFLR
jgi:hypothetical protein